MQYTLYTQMFTMSSRVLHQINSRILSKHKDTPFRIERQD
jgi:hypothetical protein